MPQKHGDALRSQEEPVVPGLSLEGEQELLGPSFFDCQFGEEVPVADEVARLIE
jgi:hypothetical protein